MFIIAYLESSGGIYGSKRSLFEIIVNPFQAMFLFYIPWKHQKTLLCGASKGFMKALKGPS